MNSRVMFNTLFVLLFIVVATLAWSCTPKKQPKMQVTVSILPQKYLVDHISGSLVDVHVMVPLGSSPEVFDPTPQDMMKVGRSALYINMGGFGFENAWLIRIANQNPRMDMVDCTRDIKRLAIDEDETDPHVWTTPANMKKMAAVVCQALIQEDPDLNHQAVYKENLALFEQKMDSLSGEISQKLADSSSRSFVIYHPALTYLAADYGFNQIGVEREHKEPSASMIFDIIKEIKASDAKVLFMQQEFDLRLGATIAQETGLELVPINPLSADWESEMKKIVSKLAK